MGFQRAARPIATRRQLSGYDSRERALVARPTGASPCPR